MNIQTIDTPTLTEMIDDLVDKREESKDKKERKDLKIQINWMMDEVETRIQRKIYKRL